MAGAERRQIRIPPTTNHQPPATKGDPMRRTLYATAVAAFVVAGCSTLGKQAFRDPVVTLADVKVTGVGLTGGSLDVVLNIENPNDFRLDATQMHYNVLVDTIPLANGTTTQRFTVEGKKSQQVHIPISFTYAGVGAAGRSLMNTGSVNYTVKGDVTVGSAVGLNVTVPFSQTGRYSTLGGNSRGD
jgi:LEA14-like dessication related protein